MIKLAAIWTQVLGWIGWLNFERNPDLTFDLTIFFARSVSVVTSKENLPNLAYPMLLYSADIIIGCLLDGHWLLVLRRMTIAQRRRSPGIRAVITVVSSDNLLIHCREFCRTMERN